MERAERDFSGQSLGASLGQLAQLAANHIHLVKKKEKFSNPGIACCVSLKMEQNASRTSSAIEKSSICSCRAKHHVVTLVVELLEPSENHELEIQIMQFV